MRIFVFVMIVSGIILGSLNVGYAQTAWQGNWYFPIRNQPGACNNWLHFNLQMQGNEIELSEVWDLTIGVHTAGESRHLTRLKILGDRNIKALSPYQDVAWKTTLLTCWLSPDGKEVNCETLSQYPGEEPRTSSMTWLRRDKCSSFRSPY